MHMCTAAVCQNAVPHCAAVLSTLRFKQAVLASRRCRQWHPAAPTSACFGLPMRFVQVSWFAGFLIPTIAFAVAITVFVSGTRLYR